VSAIARERHDLFRVDFRELERPGLRGLFRSEERPVDPFLLCRALAEIIQHASLRAASGRPLLWNEYWVVMPRADLEPLRALAGRLHRDLEDAVAGEAARLGAELVGELRIRIVADESGELSPGEATVRVDFAPDQGPLVQAAGELTIRVDSHTLAGAIDTARAAAAAAAAATRWVLSWPGGTAELTAGAQIAIGRPHQGAPPAHFIALTGASPRINKRHAWLWPGPGSIAIGRFASSNPVEVDGELVAAGESIQLAAPAAEISLSRGDLLLRLSR